MDTQLIKEVEDYVGKRFQKELKPEYTYHNNVHTSLVERSVKLLAKEASLSTNECEILTISALFHDLGFIINPDNHEVESSKLAEDFLLEKEYPNEKIEKIKSIILSTKLGSIPQCKLEELMQDADLSGLGSSNYLDICENLRTENNFRFKKEQSKLDWEKENVIFLENHEYNTAEGKKLFKEQKLKNIETLKKMETKKVKKKKLLTIGSSKSAQTQLKTALRNHIDLSAIADNKANIMLSVNAIVITVGLPLILVELQSNPQLMIPLIVLTIASVGSMIFATLSTRPAKMYGTTSMDQIKEKKSNLFFFGNYYNMSFQEYETGMKEVVADNEILDNSITRDLFFLGKSLGKKYEYLRYCYSIFMYGIVATILSYAFIAIISCTNT